jgi:hypothetical protein
MYVWIVTKWLKVGDVGLLGGMIGRLGHGGGPSSGNAGVGRGVEVRFEWKRGKGGGKKKKAGERRSQRGSVVSLNGEGNGNGSVQDGHRDKENERERKRANRLSVASQRSLTVSITSDDRHSDRSRSHTGGAGNQEEGEDSDPEDSETPWTCTLKIRRLGSMRSPRTPTPGTPYMASGFSGNGAGGEGKDATGEDEIIRVKLGTLSQTPHHPKVVAKLKVPFPLPDVDVEGLMVRRRMVMPGGVVVKSVEDDPGNGLLLTAEEIKDVVSSTGMWLVVREGLGGVGKVSRKGDGWRIRA